MKRVVSLTKELQEKLSLIDKDPYTAIRILIDRTEYSHLKQEQIEIKSNITEDNAETKPEVTSPFALYKSEEEMNAHGFLVKDIIDIDLSKNRIILEKNGGGTWFYVFKKGEILQSTLDLMKQRKADNSWNDILAQACFKRGTGKQLSLVELRV